MIARQVVVATPRGLGEEAAGRFCTTARAQPARVHVVVDDGRSADARSVLGVVELGIAAGQEVTLTADEHEAGAQASVDLLAGELARDLEPDDEPAGGQEA
ncbi:HPr family phosphocarrier protein [Actinomycetospora straminea]|uniref:HPr domain-containing protein n=1 Tax=Actinomycetospora straminea TaxID=663607 RepID=A0ABP9E2W4_9PSEU|nr:HPr family phosphocarrier protein [Actinomycetospora straminea]MDD7931231.1 HPr family phosphocarrier protein [Actinomycetospora straminea]